MNKLAMMKNNADIFQTSFFTSSAPSQLPANIKKGDKNNNKASIFFIDKNFHYLI